MAKLPTERSDKPCIACPLYEKGCTKIKARGPTTAKILVVTSGPKTNNDAIQFKHLTTDAMEVFKRAMQKNGFSKSDFVFHSATRCAYDRDIYPTIDKTRIATQCREYLLRIIEVMKPEIIIPLGVDAARAVFGKAKKITKIRGAVEWDEDYQAQIFPMIDPIMVAMYPQNWGVFKADARSLRRLMNADFDEEYVATQSTGNYHLVDDLQFLIDQKPTEICFDTETEGLRWAEPDKRLLTMQFCIKPGEAYLVSWDHPDKVASRTLKRKLRRQLTELLCRPEVNIIGQNLKYDALWLQTRTGVKIRIAEDTLMLSAIHDENNKNKDLSTLTKMFIPEMAGYDDLFNRTYDKSKMAEVPLEKIVDYGCGDTDACLRLFNYYWDQVSQDPVLLNYYYDVSIPGLNAFVNVEMRGLIINEDRLEDLRIELTEHVYMLSQSLLSQIPRSIKREHVVKGLKLSRPALLLDVLFLHPDGFCLEPKVFTDTTKKLEESLRVPSISSKNHLPFFFDICPFAEELAEWKKLDRLLGTNIEKFKENYMIGEYVYPSYQLHVTVTGRSSSQDPNGQNFPKRGTFAKAYRRIFVPPPDYLMLEADFSQVELRIAGDMANDSMMIQIYNTEGGDIHKTTALIVSGITMNQFLDLPRVEQALLRFKAKAVNFGFIYGMGWRNFIVYAKTQYGVEFTPREAQRIRDEFFSRYPALTAWHRSMREFAREHGFVRSYSGRVRHLPMIYSREEYIRQEAERQAINSPVQEFGSTLGVIALSDMDQNINPEYLPITGFVHDAIYALVPNKYAEWGAKKMKEFMEGVDIEGMFNRTMKMPMIADVTIGMNGGEQYEMTNLNVDTEYNWDADLEYDGSDFPFVLAEQEIPPDDGILVLPEYLRNAA